jgi:hypothetical protein
MVRWQVLCRKALHLSATVSSLKGLRQAGLLRLLRSKNLGGEVVTLRMSGHSGILACLGVDQSVSFN